MVSPLEQFDVIRLINFHFFEYDFSIVNTILPLFIFNIFAVCFCIGAKMHYKLIPDF